MVNTDVEIENHAKQRQILQFGRLGRHFFHACCPMPDELALFMAALVQMLPKPHDNSVVLVTAGPAQ